MAFQLPIGDPRCVAKRATQHEAIRLHVFCLEKIFFVTSGAPLRKQWSEEAQSSQSNQAW